MDKSFDAGKFKTMQKAAWNSVAHEWHQGLAPHLIPVTKKLIDWVGVSAGSSVLDLASGDGSLALAAASAGAAKVIAADLAPSFGPIVERRAREAGVEGKVTFHEADLEHLPFEDRTFDLVFCQFGLMLAPARKTALREIYRVMKPHGKFGAAVWGTADENAAWSPIVSVFNDFLPPRPEGSPSLFECGTPKLMEDELHSIGFRDYQEARLDVVFKHADLDAAWKAWQSSGPFAAAYAQWDSKTRKKVKSQVRKVHTKFKTSGGTIEVPGRALLFRGTRAFETLNISAM